MLDDSYAIYMQIYVHGQPKAKTTIYFWHSCFGYNSTANL